ncbi:NAD(P)-dependent oxidoreductase [Lentibacillus saliphilus]|uniref:NAD(P)-dependent oxidoreductase n=1 Tax=Lentibacillus saliphilus TaxID=2737028 RepID=UPI001C302D87|nr:NAD(P)-dependent oxidoreductase [Lentibacillus saliphilus]
MKIIAFNVRPDEIESFETYSKQFNHDVDIQSNLFGPHNAHLAEGYEAVCILGNCKANAEALEKIANLGVKYLATRSAGFNNIDLEAAKKWRIRVSNVPAYSPNSVAEFTVGVTLCIIRNIKKALHRVDRHHFGLGGLLGTELRNQTIGFVGTGRIGLSTIKAFSGFGARLIGYDVVVNNEAKAYIEYRSLKSVLRDSNIISLHCPLTEDNYHLINEETISTMKDGVVIINTARGGLINTDHAIDGIKSGRIGGLGLDTYEHEVGVFHNNLENDILPDGKLAELISMQNVFVTPHYGFYTDEAVANMVEYALENLYDYEAKHYCKNELAIK